MNVKRLRSHLCQATEVATRLAIYLCWVQSTEAFTQGFNKDLEVFNDWENYIGFKAAPDGVWAGDLEVRTRNLDT